jgi:hypothetical protein
MIAGVNVQFMCGLKSAFMGISFASADTFRRSLIEHRSLMPPEIHNEVALGNRQ